MAVTVLLADDHAVVRDGLRPFLAPLSDDLRVVEAGDFPTVLDIVGKGPAPDLAIVDLKMPGIGAVDDLAVLRKLAPSMRVVVFSGWVNREDVVRAFEMGLAGYLPKSLTGTAITHALQLVMSGEVHFPSSVLMQADQAGSGLSAENPFRVLSPRELEIVTHLVGGAPNKEIANRLGLTEITVKAHLRSVFRKMQVTNRTQLVVMALDHGIKA